MVTLLATLGRLVLTHGVLLVAIYLAGELAQYLLTEGIGFLGAYDATVGALLFPLVMLSRLFALVAMLLVLRDGLRGLAALAPQPERGRGRRRAFLSALLGSVLVFTVFYAGRGYLQDDWIAYQQRVLEITTGLVAQEGLLGVETGSDLARGELTLGPLTGGVIVAAFALRWAYGRYRDRLPRTAVVGAIYLESLWIVWSVLLVQQLFDAAGTWIATRQGMVWLGEIREWLVAQVAPVAAAWDAVEGVLGVVGGLVVPPLAWLAIAGAVYGFAVSAPAPQLGGRRVEAVRSRYERVPDWLRARLGDLWKQVTGRFRPLINALVLMWRAGPVLIGAFVLLFTAVQTLEALLEVGVARMFGPQDRIEFWLPYGTLVFLLVPLVIEPLRLIVVAAAYDRVVARVGTPPEGASPDPGAGPEPAAVPGDAGAGEAEAGAPAPESGGLSR